MFDGQILPRPHRQTGETRRKRRRGQIVDDVDFPEAQPVTTDKQKRIKILGAGPEAFAQSTYAPESSPFS
jgi:hypothetical protein